MYAIVEIAGKQFRVDKNKRLKVPKLNAESGSKLKFDKILFFADETGKNQIGNPLLKDLAVSATVVEHGREKKIIVFKKKRRKGYQVKNGHRQDFSLIKIDDIGIAKKTLKAEAKVAEPKAEVKAEPIAEQKLKAEGKKKTAAAPPKTPAAKKAVTKKTASAATKKSAKSPAKKEVKTKAKSTRAGKKEA